MKKAAPSVVETHQRRIVYKFTQAELQMILGDKVCRMAGIPFEKWRTQVEVRERRCNEGLEIEVIMIEDIKGGDIVAAEPEKDVP